MREGQKATIACKSRRPNRLKVLQTASIASKSLQAEDDLMGKQNLLTFRILHLFGCLSSTLLLILTVLFLCLLHLRLQALFKLSSETAGRSLYVHFQNAPLPSKAPILLALSCSPAQQWSRAADSSGTFGQPSLTDSFSAWGITAPGTL